MLIFNLKKEWFEKIKSGEKTHEYREVKPYWKSRLRYPIHLLESGEIKRFPADIVCGYPSKNDFSKIIEIEILSIKIVDGKNTDLKLDTDVYDIEFQIV